MVIAQGEIWWADLSPPIGSAPGFRRPVVIVQGDAFNRSRIRTVVCVPVTSNLRLADMPGNVRLTMAVSRLPKDSVANVAAIVTIDRTLLQERISKLSPAKLALILSGIDVVLGLSNPSGVTSTP